MHVVRGLVDHKGVALGQTDLRELDRAGQMEDLERQALRQVCTGCNSSSLASGLEASYKYGYV